MHPQDHEQTPPLRLFRLIHRAEEAIISLLLVAMTLLVFWEVVLRMLNTGVTWIQEATLLLSAWLVLFGASYGLKVGAHIGVDAFVRLLSPLGQRLVTAAALLLALAYCGLFGYGSWVYLDKMYRIGIELEDIPVQTWLAHGILLIGFLLLSIRLIDLLWRVVTGKATGFQRTGETEEGRHLAEKIERKATES